MSELALVPLLRDRPAIVKVSGVSIFVSVHDKWFQSEARRLYNRMLRVHPDKPVEITERSVGISQKGQGFTSDQARKMVRVNLTYKRGRQSFQKMRKHLGCFLSRERDGFYKQVSLDPPDWSRWQSLADLRNLNARPQNDSTLPTALYLASLAEEVM